MADKKDDLNDLKELKDVLKDIASQLTSASAASKSLIDKLAKQEKVAQDFGSALEDVLMTSGEIGQKFSSISSLQDAMKKDAKLLAKVEEQIFKNMKSQFGAMEDRIKIEFERRKQTVKKEDDLRKLDDARKEALKEIEEMEVETLAHVMKSLEMKKRELEVSNKITLSLRNIKDIMDDLGAAIRDPSIAANNMLKALGGIPKRLLEANQAGKSFSDVIVGLGKQGMQGLKAGISLLFNPVTRTYYCSVSPLQP